MQGQREFALLRMMGLRRGRVMPYVLAEEGLAPGIAGAVIGLLGGAGLAALALHLVGGDLGGGSRPSLNLAPKASVLFAALGVGTALLGSLVPAGTVVALPPVQMLKRLAPADHGTRSRAWPGLLLLLALDGGSVLIGPVADLPLFGYLAVEALLAGGVALMPWLLSPGLRPVRQAVGTLPHPLSGLEAAGRRSGTGFDRPWRGWWPARA